MQENSQKGIGCGGTILRALLVVGVIFLISSWRDKGTSAGSESEKQEPLPTIAVKEIETVKIVTDPSLVATERNWNSVMTLPTAAEITEFDKGRTWASPRSPYIGGWMDTSMCDGYTEYSIEFKADYIPRGTYCCGANFCLNYSVLDESYADVRTDYGGGIAGYAGLQMNLDDTTNAIMTIWDRFCTDDTGNQTVVRAKLIYPEAAAASPNIDMQEGSFVHFLPPFKWEAGRWYRMVLRCTEIPDTDHTAMEMTIVDLKDNVSTLVCAYDLGVPGVFFENMIAFFLECFDPTFAGEVRSMECRNIQITDLSGRTHRLTNCYMNQSYDYPGSYRYGADDSTFYMITTGIPEKAGTLQEPAWFSIQ